jgi:hypothetical protein
MRIFLPLLLACALVSTSAQTPLDRSREIDNVAAFARLYGVVRYFYPSDAAATVDWDRFAVLGVNRARSARDAAALRTALADLIAPLGPGIELATRLPAPPASGSVDAALVAWHYMGPGTGPTTTQGSPYSATRTNRTIAPTAQQSVGEFVALAQSVPAAEWRGKRIRLRARARVAEPDNPGRAGLWLRVDRTPQAVGFFDNMQDRPIRLGEWREYVIEGPVADDASAVAFGALTSGPGAAEFDAFELSVLDGETWRPVTIRDPGFETGNDPRSSGWMGNGISGSHITTSEVSAPEGRRFVRLAAVVASAGGATSPNTTARAGAYADVDLGLGLHARVRTSLSDDEARLASSSDTWKASIDAITPPSGRLDLDVRLADVVVAWNVLRHFYPYWDVSDVDWDARLVPHLGAAHAANTRDEQRRALLQLVADARDGHGNVIDSTLRDTRGYLPIDVRLVEGRVAVVATSVPDVVPVGSVVTAIGDSSANARLESEMQLVSGSPQWKRWRGSREIGRCDTTAAATPVSLELADRTTRQLTLTCAPQPPVEHRPEPIAQLSPDIQYVDLTRATMATIGPAVPSITSAKGVVFDLRGYPTDSGFGVLPHLVGEPESDRWMHVAAISGPFGQVTEWQSHGWNLTPRAPQAAGRRVFLTDGRAISYAESVLGYVKDRKLATIVGGATAGANGNVVRAVVPGGFAFTFTGMRVTGHDGRAQHHLIGVVPDVALEPTIEGLRSGRDELLEYAVALIRDGR